MKKSKSTLVDALIFMNLRLSHWIRTHWRQNRLRD